MFGDAMEDSYESVEDYGDSDESYGDEIGEDVEDIGEARRKRRRRNHPAPRGVQGFRVPQQGGGSQVVRFPAKLATNEEVTRGFASVQDRVARLENRFGRQLKNANSVSSLVTFGVGGGLAGYGAIKASVQDSSNKLKRWTEEYTTKAANIVSFTQLFNSGAQLLFGQRRQRSGVQLAADIYAVAELALYAYGSFSTPTHQDFVSTDLHPDAVVKDRNTAETNLGSYSAGALVWIEQSSELMRVIVAKDSSRGLYRIKQYSRS